MSYLETLRIAPSSLGVVINLVLLALVLRAPRKSLLYLVFAAFLVGMALWALASWGMAARPSSSIALVWQRLVLASLALVAATYLHFVLLLTRRITTLKPVVAVYMAGGALLLLALTPLVAARVDAVSYGWAPAGGVLTAVWLGLIQGFFFASLVILGLAYWRSEVSEEKDRYVLFALGALSAMLGTATDFLAARGLMAYPFGVFGGIGFTLLAGMAAMRHNLLDVQVAVRRGAVYLAFSLAITALYMLVVAVGQSLAQRQAFPFYIQALIVFGLALAFTPAVRYLGEQADRWVYGKRSDYLRLLRSIAASSQKLTELPVLARELTDALRVAMRASDVWLLLPNPKGDYAPALGDGPTLGVNSPVLKWLQQNPRPLSRGYVESSAFAERLSEEERAALRRWDVRLLIPMRAPSGLLGVMALGPRQTLERYSQAEIDALYTAAQQVAVSVENARLFTVEREQVRFLQELDRMKADFLDMISHQLKTPLTSITTATALLRESEPADAAPVRARLIANLERSAGALQALVSDLLDFIKLRSGRMTIVARPVALRDMVDETVSLLSPQIEKREQKVMVDVEELPVMVAGDGHKLAQVLVNLLSNASAYSPPGSAIRIRVVRDNGEALVSVSDSCGGIPDADQPYLFEAYRMSRSRSPEAAPTGTGLGLSIARALVNLHGGRLWFTNQAPRGCTFTFALPLMREPVGETSEKASDRQP